MISPQMESAGKPPMIAVIGGVDPSGGAGLLRDALTAVELGCHPYAVGTAWTEQGEGTHRVEARDRRQLADAVRRAVARGPAAIKIGMVPDAGAAAAVLEGLAGYGGPVVVDPVLASSRGGVLWGSTSTDMLPLLRRALLATPNASEASALAGRPVRDAREAEAAGAALLDQGLAAVLVKGGHLGGPSDPVTDVLLTAAGVRRLTHPRLPGPSPRGTGCALATAVAVELARARPLEAAVEAAIAWLARAIAAAIDVGGERHLGRAR